MSDINHRRKNKKPVNQRHAHYHNGYAHPTNKGGVKQQEKEINELKAEYEALGITNVHFPTASSGAPRVGRTDFLDKSMHGWGRKCQVADSSVGAGIGNDFAHGHRGMAKAVAGAKKYVRSRVRFQDNAATQKLAKNYEITED